MPVLSSPGLLLARGIRLSCNYDPGVARVVSKLSRIRCMDCQRDTGANGLKEYPTMIRDGVLCRADMERRLGRPLVEADMAP
jgi:hypothetical protein